jgi:hypothetical protein
VKALSSNPNTAKKKKKSSKNKSQYRDTGLSTPRPALKMPKE